MYNNIETLERARELTMAGVIEDDIGYLFKAIDIIDAIIMYERQEAREYEDWLEGVAVNAKTVLGQTRKRI
jgi:hypothetical protein